jgi:predicted transcriptional regulator
MKAIIDLAKRNTVFETAAAQYAVTQKGGVAPDYRLHFESARALFAELTPARIELLDTLHSNGPCSVYALARAAQRNYSNVHTDIAALERLELVQRDESDAVFVPFDSVEIRLALSKAA